MGIGINSSITADRRMASDGVEEFRLRSYSVRATSQSSIAGNTGFTVWEVPSMPFFGGHIGVAYYIHFTSGTSNVRHDGGLWFR